MANSAIGRTPTVASPELRALQLPMRVYRWLLVLLLALVWELVARIGVFSPIVFPSLLDVAVGLWSSATERELFRHVGVTVAQILAAFSIAAGTGVPIGLYMGRIRPFGHALTPFLRFGLSVPLIALAPFFTLMLGLGSASKIAFGSIYAFFPIAMTTYAQAGAIEPELIQLSRSLGMSRLQRLRKIILMRCVPGIVAGLGSGMALAIIGVIAMEMLASLAGVGYLLDRSKTGIRTGEVYGLVLLTLTLGAVLNRPIHAVGFWLRKEWQLD